MALPPLRDVPGTDGGSESPQVPGGAAGLGDLSLQAPLTCFPATDKPSFLCALQSASSQAEGLGQPCIVRCRLALLSNEVFFFIEAFTRLFFKRDTLAHSDLSTVLTCPSWALGNQKLHVTCFTAAPLSCACRPCPQEISFSKSKIGLPLSQLSKNPLPYRLPW